MSDDQLQLHFHVDPASGLPIYRQVMDQLTWYISAGTLEPGDQLPSIRALARQLRVNPSTVVKAYSELEHAGVIISQQGRGAFVASSAGPDSSARAESSLRHEARRLAVQAAQMGMPAERALAILREELESLDQQEGR